MNKIIEQNKSTRTLNCSRWCFDAQGTIHSRQLTNVNDNV